MNFTYSGSTRAHLAKACSGFGNSNGGVILYGMSTTKHSHSGLDLMTQIEPIANIDHFKRQVESELYSLSTPPIYNFEFRILKEKDTDTRGVLLVHLPHKIGDPVQSNIDSQFYFRSGDDFVVAPYDMIKRLFFSSQSPDLILLDNPELLKRGDDGTHALPIILQNNSSAIAEHVKVVIKIVDIADFESIISNSKDGTGFNPGNAKVFLANTIDVIHKGLNIIISTLWVKPKINDGGLVELKMTVNIYANKMEAKQFHCLIAFRDGAIESTSIREVIE